MALTEGDTGVFAEYDAEFTTLLRSSSRAIASSASASAPAGALDRADRELFEAAALLQSMELEAAAGDASALREAVQTRRDDVARVRKDLRAARIAVAKGRDEATRSALFAGVNDDVEAGSLEHRARLLNDSEKLERGSELILDSRRNIAQTESVSVQIMEDLQAQRGTILRARQNLSGVDSGLDQSTSILSAMNRRALMNKMIIYAVLAIIGMLCLGILYARVFHSRDKR